MFDVTQLVNSNFMIPLLTMIAVAGTLFTLVIPLLERDTLKSRMKSVALERDKLRARERARLATQGAGEEPCGPAESKGQVGG